MKRLSAFVFVLIASLCCVGVAAQELTIKGSTTLQPAAERWAGDFMKANSKIQVKVLGGGSGKGFEALAAGEAQLGASSRKIKPEETTAIAKRGAPQEFKVAIDGVAIFVNSSN